MVSLVNNFYANSSGLAGGGLGLKTAWACIRFNPCYALFNIATVWFSRSERLSVQCTYTPLIDPAIVVHAKLQVPSFSSVVEPSGSAAISKIRISLPPSPITIPEQGPCLVSLEGLRLHQGPYCMACECTFAKNLSNIG